MNTNKTLLSLAIASIIVSAVGCSSDDTAVTAPVLPFFDDADIIAWFDSGDNNVRGNADLGFDADAATTVPVAGTVDLQDATFSLTAAMGGTLADKFVETNYIGAFPQDIPSNWTDGWTINVNGNVTVWAPATGVTPTADGTCPAGTTVDAITATLALPNAGGTMDVCQLERRYDNSDSLASSALTLTNDNIYTLATGTPGTLIGNGDAAGITAATADNITVNVEPGTLILGSEQEALVVTRGSKININGTAADPIVMASRKWFNEWAADTAYADTDYDGVNDVGANGLGEWAGLALMGFAKSNEAATDVIAEGGIGYYAGTDDTDNSGSISHVVIRGAGNDLDGNGNELNGFTLFGVGSGTSIDHIQVHRGLDDGIEHFGSADHISHFVLTDNRDDSFDWGQGYTGSAQFGLIKHSSNAVADRMIEADNDKADPDAAPVSRPTLANITMVSGTGVLTKNGDASEGALMRRGTGFNLFNTVISQDRAKECIEIDGDATFTEVAVGDTGAVTGQTDNGKAINVVLNCQSKDGTDDLDADPSL